MLHHRTDNPAIKAGHIASRLEQEEIIRRLSSEEYLSWFEFWLESYRQVLKEIHFTGESDEQTRLHVSNS